jgi:hypothetical protein
VPRPCAHGAHRLALRRDEEDESHIELRAAMVLVEYKYERTRVLAADVTYRLVREEARSNWTARSSASPIATISSTASDISCERYSHHHGRRQRPWRGHRAGLHGAGYRVAVTDIDAGKAHPLPKRSTLETAIGLRLDVTDGAAIEAALRDRQALGRCAGAGQQCRADPRGAGARHHAR